MTQHVKFTYEDSIDLIWSIFNRFFFVGKFIKDWVNCKVKYRVLQIFVKYSITERDQVNKTLLI